MMLTVYKFLILRLKREMIFQVVGLFTNRLRVYVYQPKRGLKFSGERIVHSSSSSSSDNMTPSNPRLKSRRTNN